MTWKELPEDVKTGMRWGSYVVGFLAVLGVGVGVASTREAPLSAQDRLERMERTNARQDSAIGRLESNDEAQARADSLQTRLLEGLSCAWLYDIGLEARTPRECAADYLKRR